MIIILNRAQVASHGGVGADTYVFVTFTSSILFSQSTENDFLTGVAVEAAEELWFKGDDQ